MYPQYYSNTRLQTALKTVYRSLFYLWICVTSQRGDILLFSSWAHLRPPAVFGFRRKLMWKFSRQGRPEDFGGSKQDFKCSTKTLPAQLLTFVQNS